MRLVALELSLYPFQTFSSSSSFSRLCSPKLHPLESHYIFAKMFFSLFCLFLLIFHVGYCRKPELVQFPTVFNLELKESFHLSCNAFKGSKPINFEWLKNGQSLHYENGLIFDSKSSSSSLTFEEVNFDHSGNYSCKASNTDGFDQVSTLLQVKGLFHFLFFSAFPMIHVHFPPICGAKLVQI